MHKITIGLVDDHQLVRTGLRELIEKLGNYSVVSEYDGAMSFLNDHTTTPPDVLIVDYSMPDLSGTDLLKELERRSEDATDTEPKTHRVLLLTQHLEDSIIDEAFYYGARGFLHKNCAAQDLKYAIDSIAATGYANVVEILRRVKRFDTAAHGLQDRPLPGITRRELEFLELVCDERELTYDQMADIMCVSVKSVESYRSALFEKFKIKSKVGLVLFSYQNKLTPPFT
ncbi:response regulator [Flavobacterium sp. RHBU_3]|uniref:response regulator transcription factor n=1 Tax=Flavobacterium sp. RHBU_3 TaxID=3391184 RepID=UPI003984732C